MANDWTEGQRIAQEFSIKQVGLTQTESEWLAAEINAAIEKATKPLAGALAIASATCSPYARIVADKALAAYRRQIK